MKIYLVESEINNDSSFDIIATMPDFCSALNLLVNKDGLITEMIVGLPYLNGIGICNHWHIKDGKIIGEDF